MRDRIAATEPRPHRDAGRARELAELGAGLARPQKEISPKYFYDERGSELFEEITRLPEYYLTRAERSVLETWAPEWIATRRPRALVELGAGSAVKTRILLDAMLDAGHAERYAPVDVSREFLAATARAVAAEYPDIIVTPIAADISRDPGIPRDLPRPAVIAFLGSTIGNFARQDAICLLSRVAVAMDPADRLLLGADLVKDPAVLEAAYDDAAGVTAEFSRNMLRVLNARFGADFDPDAYAHRAIYDATERRMEMHLVAREPQVVTIPGAGRFEVARGESIRTEISCKYDRESIAAMLGGAGLRLERWTTDAEGRFALAVGALA